MPKVLAVVLGAILLVSYLGVLHPAGDSLAVFRPVWALLFALATIWSAWPRRIRWPLAVSGMLSLLQVFWPGWMPRQSPDQSLKLYQQNLLFNRRENDEWLEAIAKAQPDVITLQEVSKKNTSLLDELRPNYPALTLCPFAAVGGVAVLSPFPKVPDSAVCARGVAAMQVVSPHGPVTVVSLHLHWPWPYGQSHQVEELLSMLARLERPVVLAGDFNAVGWSHTVRQIARVTGTRRVGPSGATFALPHIPYPVTIDHVLAPDGIAQVQPRLGSDHNGVLAYVRPY
ncbi:endonuclease/exonuclease/phosphatase family protein [Lutimaribacter marinistellae]|uniref:Endonuclease/exonuclease/phosphatase family protein n=1 Tax=Lutimaribacter marinistellae TaxID=1820329 RepID=A0ABV7TPV2_9RHOB